jgi:plastocyanin
MLLSSITTIIKKVDIDLGFAENGNATFTATQAGIFDIYCKYHLPVMAGQLVVLP